MFRHVEKQLVPYPKGSMGKASSNADAFAGPKIRFHNALGLDIDPFDLLYASHEIYNFAEFLATLY